MATTPQAAPFVNPLGSTLRVKLDGLVVRALPDAKSDPLMQLGYDSVVTMGDKDPQPKATQLWRNAVVGKIDGWVASQWVEPAKLSPNIKPYVKPEPGINNPSGPQPLAKPLTIFTADTDKEYVVLAKSLALRLTPDINAPALANLLQGQAVRGLRLEPRGIWRAIEADGKRGWASTQWLQPVKSSTADSPPTATTP
jgi:pilus assembly protein CpaC